MTATSEKSAAFRAAMDALAQVQPAETDLVQFVSRGKALLLAPPAQAEAAAAAVKALAPELTVTVSSAEVEISGYLGAFEVREGSTARQADIIIDYHTPPLLQRQQPRMRTLPLGYFAVTQEGGKDEADTLASARTMTGTFTKPRYFSYQKDICAHGSATLSGCSRCLDACATQAITSAGDKIAVNPHLCQGCGGCVMTCPSGALRYAYPPPKDMLEGLRAALNAYQRESDTHAAAVLFYAAESAAAIRAAQLPPHFLPIAVEEAGVAGLEIWFATLAYGAGQVAVFADNAGIAAIAREQLRTAHTLLEALGLPQAAIAVVEELSVLAAAAPSAALAPPAQFAADNDKRHIFFMALNHFVAQATLEDPMISLPQGAPFGEIAVDSKSCTLCMACAGACPVSAVRAGNTAPRLTFIEENCLQCGLCAATCPEDAITLLPRLNTDKSARRQARLLNEDQPLHCLRCSKPFASARVVSKMEEKLKGHWMFKEPQALRRLRLCEDCRVLDMYESEAK